MTQTDMSRFDWSTETVLVTGGTGSFGRQFVEALLREHPPRKLIVFSRDELKQYQMRERFADGAGSPLRYFIGDIRDVDRLRRAMNGVTTVVHAAAMKHVDACEYNPIEAVMTNVLGTKNVIEAALDREVRRALFLSTDKAVSPVNLYGATKLVAEKLFIQANAYSGLGPTRFSCVRYGNVVGSRGSVLPLFVKQRRNGRVTVTDPRMSRFWITLEQGVRFVVDCLGRMTGGEVFIPKIPSTAIMDLVEAAAPDCEVEFIGIRPGEKLHEVLLSRDEARNALELDDMFIIKPVDLLRDLASPASMYATGPWNEGHPLPDGFWYASDNNPDNLRGDRLREVLGDSTSIDDLVNGHAD